MSRVLVPNLIAVTDSLVKHVVIVSHCGLLSPLVLRFLNAVLLAGRFEQREEVFECLAVMVNEGEVLGEGFPFVGLHDLFKVLHGLHSSFVV